MRAMQGTSFTNGMNLSGGPFSDAVFNLNMIKIAYRLSRDASVSSVDNINTNYAHSVQISL